MLKALSEGLVIEVQAVGKIEATVEGFMVNGVICSVGLNQDILRHITCIYRKEELPWYECMEVGQTVLVKLLEYTASYAVVRKKSKDVWIFNSNDMYEVPASIVARYIPLIPEEVSKLAFDNVCN